MPPRALWSRLIVAALALCLGARAQAGGLAVGGLIGFGVDVYPQTPIAAGELLALELRVDVPDRPWNLDVLVDWEQLLASSLLTSQPRLGLTTLAHLRRPLTPRLDLAVAPGLDLEWGRDARVIDEQLRWVPAGCFGLSARLGLDLHLGRRWELGVYARGVGGFRAGSEGPEAWRQALGELTLTRRLGARTAPPT